MKLISSVIRPEKIEAVREALRKVNVCGLTVSDARDHTPQRQETTVWHGREYSVGFSLKAEMKVTVHDDDVDEVVKVIIKTAQTGQIGDGSVSVIPVEHRYEIRSGERRVS
jgi:nitrogen regulatory protein P-II 1